MHISKYIAPPSNVDVSPPSPQLFLRFPTPYLLYIIYKQYRLIINNTEVNVPILDVYCCNTGAAPWLAILGHSSQWFAQLWPKHCCFQHDLGRLSCQLLGGQCHKKDMRHLLLSAHAQKPRHSLECVWNGHCYFWRLHV